MKIFYIIDENGEFYSEDRKVRYKELRGKALHKYLSTEEGKSKYFSKDVDDYGNVIGIEIPVIHKAKQEKERRHARHLRDTREKYTVWSIDACIGEDFEETFESIIADEESDEIFDMIARKERTKDLINILSSLDKEEVELIFNIFLADDPLSETEYAEVTGTSQQVISYRKKILLEHLKKFLK